MWRSPPTTTYGLTRHPAEYHDVARTRGAWKFSHFRELVTA
ncbi:hypothetical protein TSAR_006810 [Trichomalopsis sarcophagae]|uniref:Uncharacterized protein n=1 Tax=Trichomalopsis sarcophagae TaxID=543379 RepID=A0A232F3E4_9HYME|nr:hypothetical protein TSAR_006810 [Trichomalopsis sarcophagae]